MLKQLRAYLQRIGYDGTPQPDYETLRRMHRLHLLAIPYENLDIHRGRTLSLDEDLIFDKLVTQRRGGWCFEMNGLFAWALREIGFDVILLAGTVNRQIQGSVAEGNHLVLRVNLERPYLADVGFGTGFLEPLPLAEGSYTRGYLTYRLSRTATHWLFQNDAAAGPGFDFTEAPRQLSDFSAGCQRLQSAPTSSFVNVTVCHRYHSAGIVSMRGAVLRTVTEKGTAEQVIDTYPDYDRALREQFDLHLDDSAALWEKVWHKHQDWVKSLNGA